MAFDPSQVLPTWAIDTILTRPDLDEFMAAQSLHGREEYLRRIATLRELFVKEDERPGADASRPTTVGV